MTAANAQTLLRAVRDPLAAREDQMLTSAEWDALRRAADDCDGDGDDHARVQPDDPRSPE